MARKRSHSAVAASARRIAASGIACPNEMVAVFTCPPHRSHTGRVPSSVNASRMGSSVYGAPHSMHFAYVEFPCSSTTRASGTPDLWCSPSMFWVITVVTMPRCTSDATARWPWLGSARPMVRWLSTRWLHASRRADSDATKSRKSTGRRRDHMPPGLRKSGIPDSVLMPAPVNTTARRAFSTSARRRSTSGSPTTGEVNDHPDRSGRRRRLSHNRMYSDQARGASQSSMMVVVKHMCRSQRNAGRTVLDNVMG